MNIAHVFEKHGMLCVCVCACASNAQVLDAFPQAVHGLGDSDDEEEEDESGDEEDPSEAAQRARVSCLLPTQAAC
eukprot:4834773-Amphidinium_carterae.1